MKRIFSIIGILFFTLTVSAQVGLRRNDFSIGASGGYTLNSMSFYPGIRQRMKGAPMFGFATRFICEKYFALICGVQGEVNYTTLGWTENIDDGSGNTFSRDIHTIQVPLLMHLGFGREVKGFKGFIVAGPQFGFILGTKDHRGGGEWDISHRPGGVTYQYDHPLDRKFDYGIAAGLGVEFSSVAGHFALEGRFYYGLGDLYDNSKRGYFGRSANMTIYAKLTYLFDIIKTKNCVRK